MEEPAQGGSSLKVPGAPDVGSPARAGSQGQASPARRGGAVSIWPGSTGTPGARARLPDSLGQPPPLTEGRPCEREARVECVPAQCDGAMLLLLPWGHQVSGPSPTSGSPGGGLRPWQPWGGRGAGLGSERWGGETRLLVQRAPSGAPLLLLCHRADRPTLPMRAQCDPGDACGLRSVLRGTQQQHRTKAGMRFWPGCLHKPMPGCMPGAAHSLLALTRMSPELREAARLAILGPQVPAEMGQVLPPRPGWLEGAGAQEAAPRPGTRTLVMKTKMGTVWKVRRKTRT